MLCTLFWLQYRYILYFIYASLCKCDIIIQFAVHLYDCTLYERSLQLNCFHILKWFLHRSKIWANKSLHVTSLILKKSVAGHGPGWSSSLFVFQDFNGDNAKCLPRNTEQCKSSELKLKLKLNFWVRTPLPTRLDVNCGANYAAVISSTSLSKDAWAICFFAWCCCAPKGVATPCKVTQQG